MNKYVALARKKERAAAAVKALKSHGDATLTPQAEIAKPEKFVLDLQALRVELTEKYPENANEISQDISHDIKDATTRIVRLKIQLVKPDVMGL
jgi:hypothetical protein